MDSAVRAGLGASAALHALVLIYTGMVLIVNVDRLELTGIHARVIETAAAQVGYHVTGFRTLVTGDIDDLNHVGILSASSDSQPYPFSHDRSVFVYAAALRRFVLWYNFAGDLVEFGKYVVPLPGLNRYFAKNIILDFLHFVIK